MKIQSLSTLPHVNRKSGEFSQSTKRFWIFTALKHQKTKEK